MLGYVGRQTAREFKAASTCSYLAKLLEQPTKNSILKEVSEKMLNSNQKQFALVILVVLLATIAFDDFSFKVSAEPTLSLDINKISGFQSGSVLSGSFVVNSIVSDDVERVEYYLNGTLQANDTESPFNWTSNTANYPVGNYNITAVAYSASEQKAVSTINETFVEMPILTQILLLVLILVGLFIAAPILYVWHITRKPKTTGGNKQDQPK